MKKVLVITGSTASGKSEYAIELAKKYNGEIISCDSVQVYRGMDIGSAKVCDTQGIVHHMIDILEIDEPMSVALFQKLARQHIDDITNRGKLPICVGGTGYYIKALLYDYRFEQEAEVDDNFDEYSNEELHAYLEKQDPHEAKKIHVNNRKRLLRVIRLMERQNTTRTEIVNRQSDEPLYDAKVVYLTYHRETLVRRIHQRVDQMIAAGLVDEVRRLSINGFDLQSLSAIGYREFKDYFSGHGELDDVVEQIKTHTRQFSKRQMTWFKNQMPGSIEYVEDGLDKVSSEIEDWLFDRI